MANHPFFALKEKIFLKLYLSQTISLLGDAFTWVGIALLAFQFGGEQSALILSTALTLRVTAFIIFGPYAGKRPEAGTGMNIATGSLACVITQTLTSAGTSVPEVTRS